MGTFRYLYAVNKIRIELDNIVSNIRYIFLPVLSRILIVHYTIATPDNALRCLDLQVCNIYQNIWPFRQLSWVIIAWKWLNRRSFKRYVLVSSMTTARNCNGIFANLLQWTLYNSNPYNSNLPLTRTTSSARRATHPSIWLSITRNSITRTVSDSPWIFKS